MTHPLFSIPFFLRCPKGADDSNQPAVYGSSGCCTFYVGSFTTFVVEMEKKLVLCKPSRRMFFLVGGRH